MVAKCILTDPSLGWVSCGHLKMLCQGLGIFFFFETLKILRFISLMHKAGPPH